MKTKLLWITVLLGALNSNLANAGESKTYMGLAIGGGAANFTARVGMNYDNDYAIELNYINLNDDGDYEHSEFYIVNYKPYFPISDSSKFSLSVGVGFFSRQDDDDINNDESGMGFVLGAGYELSLSESIDITAEISTDVRFGINVSF